MPVGTSGYFLGKQVGIWFVVKSGVHFVLLKSTKAIVVLAENQDVHCVFLRNTLNFKCVFKEKWDA